MDSRCNLCNIWLYCSKRSLLPQWAVPIGMRWNIAWKELLSDIVVEIGSVGEERATNGKNLDFLKKGLRRGMMIFSPNYSQTARVKAITPIQTNGFCGLFVINFVLQSTIRISGSEMLLNENRIMWQGIAIRRWKGMAWVFWLER